MRNAENLTFDEIVSKKGAVAALLQNPYDAICELTVKLRVLLGRVTDEISSEINENAKENFFRWIRGQKWTEVGQAFQAVLGADGACMVYGNYLVCFL